MKPIILFIGLFFGSNLFSQTEDTMTEIPMCTPHALARNSVFLELFGNSGYLYSINYDRRWNSFKRMSVIVGMGMQYLPKSDISEDHILSFSPQVSLLFGNVHYFETGVGVTYDIIGNGLVYPIRIGYRYQKYARGLMLRAGFTPYIAQNITFFGDIEGYRIFPWGGVGVGWSF